MRSSAMNVIELLIGAILIGLGLIYLSSQYRSLFNLTDIISREIIEDSNLYQQYNDISINKISSDEVYAAIMGDREYPIMVDEFIIPQNGQSYQLYFTYIKNGAYLKEYRHDKNRNIIMIVFSYLGV